MGSLHARDKSGTTLFPISKIMEQFKLALANKEAKQLFIRDERDRDRWDRYTHATKAELRFSNLKTSWSSSRWRLRTRRLSNSILEMSEIAIDGIATRTRQKRKLRTRRLSNSSLQMRDIAIDGIATRTRQKRNYAFPISKHHGAVQDGACEQGG